MENSWRKESCKNYRHNFKSMLCEKKTKETQQEGLTEVISYVSKIITYLYLH